MFKYSSFLSCFKELFTYNLKFVNDTWQNHFNNDLCTYLSIRK